MKATNKDIQPYDLPYPKYLQIIIIRNISISTIDIKIYKGQNTCHQPQHFFLDGLVLSLISSARFNLIFSIPIKDYDISLNS